MMLLLVRRSQRGLCRPSQFLERAEESDIVYAQEGLALSSLHSQPDVMQSYSGTDAEPSNPGGDIAFAATDDSAEPVFETDVVSVSVSW